jgi:hypothetical protein
MSALADDNECSNPPKNIVEAFKYCIIFSERQYVDSGDFVAVKGTLTADWVGYKNNNWSVMCSHDNCAALSVEQIGPHQLGSIDGPWIYSISKWTSGEIIAERDDFCFRLTLTIDRTAKTLLYVDTPINLSASFCSRRNPKEVLAATIENPPYHESRK